MKLNEILNKNVNIFEYYKENNTDEFNFLYGDKTYFELKMLNRLFLSKYGERCLNNFMEESVNDSDILPAVLYMFRLQYNKLVNIKELIEKDYDILDVSKETIKETVKNSGNNNNIMENESYENVYGVNSETPVKDNSTGNTDKSNNIYENNTTKEYVKTGMNTNLTIGKLIEDDIKHKIDNDFIEKSLQVYADCVTINMY